MLIASSFSTRRALIGCWSTDQRRYQIERSLILDHALDIFGARSVALRWFESPARALDGVAPCQVVKLPLGYFEVWLLLKRIDLCIYI